jgi:hypothetical protein
MHVAHGPGALQGHAALERTALMIKRRDAHEPPKDDRGAAAKERELKVVLKSH